MLANLLERLDRRRFAPYVISLSHGGVLASRILALGVPVETIAMSRKLSSVVTFARLVRRLKVLEPDIVHTWMYHADLIGGLAARLAGVPAISWCLRNSDLNKIESKTLTRIVVNLCALLSERLPLRILSCSERGRTVHQGLGYSAKKMLVIPNGFDLDRFKPLGGARARIRVELGVALDTPLVGLIGRFDPQKNHVGFLIVAGILHRRMPNVHFILVGKDVDVFNSKLTLAIRAEGLSFNTHLLGVRDDVPLLMASLDVLASYSSYGEGFPNVVGEAMACGVPCVVTDVGDSAYIVGNTGHVVAVGNISGFAEALESLIRLTPVERQALGDQARDRVAAHFDIRRVVRQYEEFYDGLLAMAC